jgi:hypothetical protein
LKKLSLLPLAFVLLASNVQASQTYILHGLFCNTEAQAKQVISHSMKLHSLLVAVEMINAESIVCVVADKIKFMVIHPVLINTNKQQDLSLTLYEATLVGVLVGENPRPVKPPMQTFFFVNGQLTGAATQGGA